MECCKVNLKRLDVEKSRVVLFSTFADQWCDRKGIVVGDVVTFSSVVENGERVIKRIIGLEGDWVGVGTPGQGSGDVLQVCIPSPSTDHG